MNKRQLPRWRFSVILLMVVLELAHLAWEYFNGGVLSHHILNRSDLPAISNWWGLLLIPALTWFLSGRMQKRMTRHSSDEATTLQQLESKQPAGAVGGMVVGFGCSLLFGLLLSVSFMRGNQDVTLYLFEGALLLALLLPIYRAEYLLGFVISMTFTFGAVLPAAIGSMIVALSATAHFVVYPLLMRWWTWLKQVLWLRQT